MPKMFNKYAEKYPAQFLSNNFFHYSECVFSENKPKIVIRDY